MSASATDGDALDDVLFVQGLERARAFVAGLKAQSPIEVLFFAPASEGYRLERLGAQPLPTSRP